MGILDRKGKRLLWVIPNDVYPQRDATAKYWIKPRLREAVLTDAGPEKRTLALLSLLHALNMLNLIFTKDERKAARSQIEQFVGDGLFGRAVAEAVEAIDQSAAQALLSSAAN